MWKKHIKIKKKPNLISPSPPFLCDLSNLREGEREKGGLVAKRGSVAVWDLFVFFSLTFHLCTFWLHLGFMAVQETEAGRCVTSITVLFPSKLLFFTTVPVVTHVPNFISLCAHITWNWCLNKKKKNILKKRNNVLGCWAWEQNNNNTSTQVRQHSRTHSHRGCLKMQPRSTMRWPLHKWLLPHCVTQEAIRI